MQQRCDDWTTLECVEGGIVDDGSGGSGSSGTDEVQYNDPTGATPEQIEGAIATVSDILFGLTQRKYTGICGPREVRPCSRCPSGAPLWWQLQGIVTASDWARSNDWWQWHDSWGECSCGRNPCSCVSISRISLGIYPIVAATITIDGEVLPEADHWKIVEHQWFDRIDGELWPLCTNPDADRDADGTFVVDVSYGLEVPLGGQTVACFYARQFALAFAGQPCELPSRVATIVRQGTTMTFHDPASLLRDGLTGVDVVDQWIASDNPDIRNSTPTTFIIPGVARDRAQLGPFAV